MIFPFCLTSERDITNSPNVLHLDVNSSTSPVEKLELKPYRHNQEKGSISEEYITFSQGIRRHVHSNPSSGRFVARFLDLPGVDFAPHTEDTIRLYTNSLCASPSI